MAEAIERRFHIGEDFEFDCLKMLEAEVADEVRQCSSSLGTMPIKELLGQANHNFLHYWLAEQSEEVEADAAWEAIRNRYLRNYGDILRPLLDRLEAIRKAGKAG